MNAKGAAVINAKEVVRQAGRERINEFLRSHSCYDLLKSSGKVVVFDSSIPIQLAFYALVEHGECVSCWLLGVSNKTPPLPCIHGMHVGFRLLYVHH